MYAMNVQCVTFASGVVYCVHYIEDKDKSEKNKKTKNVITDGMRIHDQV